VIDGEQLVLGYVARDRSASTRVVHPLGLATKGTVWYLVANTDGGLRTFRVDRVTALERTGEPVVRPDGFDLEEAWRLITSEVDQRRAAVWAHGTAVREVVGYLRMVFGTRVRIGPARDDGRIEVELRGTSTYALARELCPFGAAVEVEQPETVRDHLARIGGELAATYGPVNLA
jgi:predicted DNA-binding transcriptional regulator YafY